MTKDINQIAIESLQELDPNMEVARYLDGHGVYTAAEMIEEIKKGSEVSRDFVTNWVRLARDFIAKNNPYAEYKKQEEYNRELNKYTLIATAILGVVFIIMMLAPWAFDRIKASSCVYPTSQPNPTQSR